MVHDGTAAISQFVFECHSSGLSIIETIKRVHLQFGLSLPDAKCFVSSQQCYSEIAGAARIFQEEAIRILEQSSDKP